MFAHSQCRPSSSRIVLAVLGIGAIAGFATQAAATGWYVDGLNGSKQNNGTQGSPYLYLWEALQKVQPGDTIYLVNSMTYGFQGFTANGTSTAPITLSGSDPANPTKISGGGVNQGIWINGDYLVVENFDVTAPGAYPAVGTSANKHHITIASNVLHDAGQNGINTYANDYVTISHNIVYNNANNTTKGFGSGISILGGVDIDTNTGVKIIIDGNIIYNNTNVPNCSTPQCFSTAQDTDGSGIILDTNQRQRWDNIPYKGAYLISNNVIYKNGGRGIHVYRSDNATITGNTTWDNNQDPYNNFFRPGEVTALQSGNVAIYDNLLYSDGLNGLQLGGEPNTHVVVAFDTNTDGTGPMIAEHNLGYNPQKDSTLFYYGKGNTNPVTVGPNLFAGAKLENPAKGDLRFRSGSVAYGAADVATSVALDILGASRMPTPSIGAYQNPGP